MEKFKSPISSAEMQIEIKSRMDKLKKTSILGLYTGMTALAIGSLVVGISPDLPILVKAGFWLISGTATSCLSLIYGEVRNLDNSINSAISDSVDQTQCK